MSRDLNDLKQRFRRDVEKVLKACAEEGVSMVPFFTVRSPMEQAKIWRSTRSGVEIGDAIRRLREDDAMFIAHLLDDVGPQHSAPGVRGHLTNALPGESWHQWGLAVDCFWLVNGKAEWNPDGKGYKVYRRFAKHYDLFTGPTWDRVHIQGRRESSPNKILSIVEISKRLEGWYLNSLPTLPGGPARTRTYSSAKTANRALEKSTKRPAKSSSTKAAAKKRSAPTRARRRAS